MKRQSFAILLACMFMQVCSAPSYGELPEKSKESLTEEATHALEGEVLRTYERKEKAKGSYQYTYGVAEIALAAVHKGKELKSGDTVYIRYWRKRPVGRDIFEPGHYGHENVPKSGDTVTVFVEGTRQSGYDVLSPNGFFERKPSDKAESKREDSPK